MENESLTGQEFIRLANNFYNEKGYHADLKRLEVDVQLANYLVENKNKAKKKFKVALTCICTNKEYWQYVPEMMEGAKNFLLPGHEVDTFFWSDMPEEEAKKYGAKVFQIESQPWPMPTLMRYHLFLQQEEELKKYDYVFYCDVDMKFVGVVGDEILGDSLTAALHPMYALDKSLWPPYEPNEKSTAYIPRPGRVIMDGQQPRFMPMYFAGGLQGGKTEDWIKAMKQMKKNIDEDMLNNYIAIWNDESHWNKYLFENPPSVVLTPSYIFPDSLIKEYYEPRWGTMYPPKIVTITKKHSLKPLSPEDVARINRMKNA